MDVILNRSGEDVSAYSIGNFGDIRLNRVGGLLFKRICERLTTCVKSLAGKRSLEVAFGRFLGNNRVNVNEISQALAEKTNNACSGKEHVLCIQDTVQLTYPTQPVKKDDFGPTGNVDTKGLFVHPGIIVDAMNKDVMGASSIISWCRSNDVGQKPSPNRPIEEKESIRWIDTATMARDRIMSPKMITIIGDRESDILEIFQRVPDKRTHLIIRASHDRILSTDEKISEHLNNTAAAGEHSIELPKITGVRKTRQAKLSIKHSRISILDKTRDETIEVNCVAATEVSPVPVGETAISWVLLTTHDVSSCSDATNILKWYTWRWVIEQVFRTMKNKGLKIEESEIEKSNNLQNLSALCIAAAIKIMCLVESRDGKTKRAASDLFTKEELALLASLCMKVEGKTRKQKNPYAPKSLAWAAWVIARLGGWNGYSSESPPGPITMLRGLKRFEITLDGWALAKEDVCIG